jgi:hypothetical protein
VWLAGTTWGYIDGTLRETCHPSYFQILLYSGNKRCHGIKFALLCRTQTQEVWLAATTWGYIDGTLRETCHPSYFQILLYSGNKRCHGIKFQSIVTTDELFACMYGPTQFAHACFPKSLLLPKLQAFMPPDAGANDSLHKDGQGTPWNCLEDDITAIVPIW